jgi:DeoR family transcriptional regulator of aga operon
MTNAALVRQAARVIVVADHTKLGQVKFAKICDLAAVDLLLADAGASEEIVGAFTKAGVDVQLA